MPKLCGAKTRAGGSCGHAAMPNGRCRYHGGKTPKGQRNALKHGIYSSHIFDDEKDVAEDIRSANIGHLEDELVVARLQLRRSLAAQAVANGKPEIEEVIDRQGGGPNVAAREEKSRVRDYTAVIDRLLGRIESLERSRKELLKDGGVDPDADTPVGKLVVEIVGARTSPDDDGPAG